MSRETIGQVLRFAQRVGASTLDLTGGAPELNPYFRELVTRARALGLSVIDRCNLTILLEPSQEGLAEFLAENDVAITASLPCYLEENVDGQRGKGVFDASIEALRRLNRLGYGRHRTLNLVYNPQGPVLPPPQPTLESDYRRILGARFDIVFTKLFTLANMPIQRFGSTLVSKGAFADYMSLLKASHRNENLESVMCRDLVSIDWQGDIYDCDFNQMLGLRCGSTDGRAPNVDDADLDSLMGKPIVTRDHCYGCTAGQGSSCGGALDGDMRAHSSVASA